MEMSQSRGSTVYCLLLFYLSVLTAIAAINEAIENENSTQLIEKMNNHNAGLISVDESFCNRYLSHLISVKEEKGQVGLKLFAIFSYVLHTR